MTRFVAGFVTFLFVFGQLRSQPLGSGGGSHGGRNVTGNGSVCYYKGVAHLEGEAIAVDEPCLSCRCRKGALTCSLRICTDVLDPPAPGCYIVHNANQCCPQVLCDTEKKESEIEVRTVAGPTDAAGDNVCIVNGNAYAEGSALESSDSCEYCYCIKGQHKCIKPKCAMPFEGCKAMYSQNSCCPTHYDCRHVATNASRQQEEKQGCALNGRWYPEGEMVPRNDSACENCYCMHGEVRCVPITCETNLSEDCEAIREPGRCCPTSYVCSNVISGIPETQVRSLSKSARESETTETAEEEEVTVATESTTMSEETTATTAMGELTTYEDNARGRTDDGESATEFGFQGKTVDDLTTTTTTTTTTFEPEASTVLPLTSRSIIVKSDIAVVNSRNNVDYPSENRTALLDDTPTALPALQELFGSSSQAYDEYDAYDYNEPRLPPSLPNLIIFPFVAADAVVKDEEASKAPEYEQSSIKRVGTEPVFYKDYFSPPTKTEGGFVPKQPANVDPYLESPYAGKDGSFPFSQRIPSELLLPSITVQPKTNSDQCVLKGALYEHGELLSEPGDCQSCICYYGDVICQEIICPTLADGCRRSPDKDTASCCGRIICDGKGSGDLDYGQERTTKSQNRLGDVVQVTPNPFRDVIRTEPAPDLPSLMGDLLPIYTEQQTKKPVTVTYKNLVVDYYPNFLVTTTREDVRKNNYNNPVYQTTEVYPITNSLSDGPGTRDDDDVDVTNPTVTNSVSASRFTFGQVRTSIRPVATEPPRPDEYTLKGKHKYSTKTKSKTSTTVNKHDGQKTSTTERYDDDSFSIDSVLRFLFDFQTTPTPQSKVAPATTSASSPLSPSTTTRKKFAASPVSFPTGYEREEEERSRHTTRRTTPEYRYKDFGGDATDGSKKQSGLSGLLKLAGCNIYGRMYRVGKIIAELSNPCLECICTDFGVECNPLVC